MSAISPGSRVLATLAAAALALGTLTVSATSAAAKPGKPPAPRPAKNSGLVGSTLFTNPLSTTLEAAQSLTGQARADAQLLGSIPSATWFTQGTPKQVRKEVHEVVTAAAKAGRMPVLVAYNLPFRDCSQYSAGGAADTAAYQAWIDAFAAGIGNRPATVILEPDGVGIIPHYTTLDGNTEWCQPAELDPATAASERYVQLNHAVDALKARPKVSVYLDGTSSAWLNVGEVSDRLLKAGVQRADGFYLNASNYQFTTNQVVFGTWVSQCIAYASVVNPYVPGSPGNPGAFADCGNQYWNGGPATDWQGVAMSPYGEWTAGNPDPALNTSGVDSRYAGQLGSVKPTTHFVIDTSRKKRARALAVPRGRVPRPRGLVQPAGPRPRRPPDHEDRDRPGRRLPVDQGARRVRRQVLPRHVRPARPGARHRGSGGRAVVPDPGAGTDRSGEPAAATAGVRGDDRQQEGRQGLPVAAHDPQHHQEVDKAVGAVVDLQRVTDGEEGPRHAGQAVRRDRGGQPDQGAGDPEAGGPDHPRGDRQGRPRHAVAVPAERQGLHLPLTAVHPVGARFPDR